MRREGRRKAKGAASKPARARAQTGMKALPQAGPSDALDETGAVRDVVQNHLLQVVAFLAMEPPTTMYPDSLRDERVKVLRMIPPLTSGNIVRGQFKGYRNEQGVAPKSRVETYAAVRFSIDSWLWAGVPFLIRAGKSLPVTITEVLVKLRKPPLSRLSVDRNFLRFRLGPDIGISLGARVKKPGFEMVTMPVELSVVKKPQGDEVDAMKGDSMLFVREDGVEAAWAIVDPILNGQDAHEYAPGNWRPVEADHLAADLGGWHNPQKYE